MAVTLQPRHLALHPCLDVVVGRPVERFREVLEPLFELFKDVDLFGDPFQRLWITSFLEGSIWVRHLDYLTVLILVNFFCWATRRQLKRILWLERREVELVLALWQRRNLLFLLFFGRGLLSERQRLAAL